MVEKLKESLGTILGVNTVIIEEEPSESGRTDEVPSNSQVEKVERVNEEEILNHGSSNMPSSVDFHYKNSATSSVHESFSSTFNSFVGFCNNNRYRCQDAPSFVGISNIGRPLEFSESQLNEMVDNNNHVRVKGARTPDGRSNTYDYMSTGDVISNIKDLCDSTTDFRHDPKRVGTLSCAVLLKDQKVTHKNEKSKNKVIPPPPRQMHKMGGKHFGALPSCFVLSKENEYAYRLRHLKSQATNNAGFGNPSHNPRKPNRNIQNSVTEPHSSATVNSLYRNTNKCGIFCIPMFRYKNGLHSGRDAVCYRSISGSSTVTIVSKGVSNMVILKVQNSCRNYLDINPDFGWRRLVDDSKPFPSSICGFDSSKLANSPDTNVYMFYIESKKTTHVISLMELAINIVCRTVLLAATHGYIDTDSLPIYLSKSLPQHVFTTFLSRNTSSHDFSTKALPEKSFVRSASRVNKFGLTKYHHYKGIAGGGKLNDFDDECSRETMYLKCSFLGIFVISSLQRNLSAFTYKRRFANNNRRYMWTSNERKETGLGEPSPESISDTNGILSSGPTHSSITTTTGVPGDNSREEVNISGAVSGSITPPLTDTNEESGGQDDTIKSGNDTAPRGGLSARSSVDNETPPFLSHKNSLYEILPVPDYGWRLRSKSSSDVNLKVDINRTNAGLKKRFVFNLFNKRPSINSIYPQSLLCKVIPPHQKSSVVNADIGSIAMNLAEQLYRLEIGNPNREKLPKNTFGFKVISENKIQCPDGLEISVIPEEVVLNTASLIHEIYITQACLIL